MDAGHIERALARAWMREFRLHGEEHWRCVAATGLVLADLAPGCDRTLVLCFGLLDTPARETSTTTPVTASARRSTRASSLADVLILRRQDAALVL